MFTPLAQDILRVTGSLPGPSILVIGGTHGNERTGIAVVRRLQEEFSSGKQSIASGTLTLALGNPPAIAQNIRAIAGRDLNRYFSSSALAIDDGSVEFRRAQVLAQCIREADVTFDIHATNKPSVPFVASKNDEMHRAVFRWFSPENILVDPEYIFGGGQPVTTDEYADTQGKVGLCFETGWVGDETVTPQVYQAVLHYLTDIGIISGEKVSPPLDRSSVYQLTRAVIRKEEPFLFAEGKGSRSFDPISLGEVVGYHAQEPVYAEDDGVIIFPKLPEHQQVGKPVCYFAKKIFS